MKEDVLTDWPEADLFGGPFDGESRSVPRERPPVLYVPARLEEYILAANVRSPIVPIPTVHVYQLEYDDAGSFYIYIGER